MICLTKNLSAAALVLSAVCLSACTSPATTPTVVPSTAPRATASPVPLGKISLPPSHHAITPAMEAEYREKFAAWLEERSPRRYRILGLRLFTVRSDALYFQTIAEAVGADIQTRWPGATEDASWRQPDYFLVRGWSIPARPDDMLLLTVVAELKEQNAFLLGLYEIVEMRGAHEVAAPRVTTPGDAP